jgi:hypothetical protein
MTTLARVDTRAIFVDQILKYVVSGNLLSEAFFLDLRIFRVCGYNDRRISLIVVFRGPIKTPRQRGFQHLIALG